MAKGLLILVGIPTIVAVITTFAVWRTVADGDAAARATVVQADKPAGSISPQAQREYVLEVISMGVTLDKFRQGALWDALHQGHALASIRNPDPDSYPWSATDKAGLSGGRAGSTLQNAISPTPMYWVSPAFFAGPPMLDPAEQPSDTNPYPGLASSGETRSSGLSWNMFVYAGSSLAERPDRLLEKIFTFFDEHPDLPFLVVSSYDDVATRDQYRLPDTIQQLENGLYMPEMPDASAMFVLARRERVDAIRPFAFEDVDDDKVDMKTLNRLGVARRVFLAHTDLEESLPSREGYLNRTPTVAEWLQAAAAFSKRPDVYDKAISLFHPLGNPAPPKDFKPTPWFPVPWNKHQLAVFDGLPTLGYIHRPIFVPTLDEHGQPLTNRIARAAALAAGWQQALETLPEAERKSTPARVIAATAGNTEQTIALTTVLNRWTEQGGPQLDTNKPDQWIDTDARLGNTGAATWFMQMAIGVLGSYREGGVSAAINLRDPAEASIVFISPPPEAKRQSQQSPLGGDVLRNTTTPAIDPQNYQHPEPPDRPDAKESPAMTAPRGAAARLLLPHEAVRSFVLLHMPPSLSLITQETSMPKRLVIWLGFPIMVVAISSLILWRSAVEADSASRAASLQASTSTQLAPQARNEYVLEVLGIGVTLDKFRKGALWDALRQGNANVSIRNTDPKSYPWSENDKAGLSGGRAGSTLENAITPTPMYWVAPAFFAGPPMLDPNEQPSDTNPYSGLASSGETRSSGLSWNLFVYAGCTLAERPDRLMDLVFSFFDQHPDLPFVVVSSYDDLSTRDQYRLPGSNPRLLDGYYMPEMPDASAMFVLARRERVERIRPFAFDDVDEDKLDVETINRLGVARRVFLAHSSLEKSLPAREGYLNRTPSVAEWLQAAAAFSKRPGIYDKTISLLHPLGNPAPPKDFKPTPWFPVPWNKHQLAVFDRLPTLGYIHRPIFVPTLDEHGQPLTNRIARAAALAAGWQQALETLPEAERKSTPARVIAATAGNTEQTIALTTVLNRWTEQGGPQLDTNKPDQWIDTDARLGNTGAATWFMQMAIGVLGSYREGGVSAAINLRDPAEASIVFISPPPEAKRQSQHSPLGGDVLRNTTTPAIDPQNYRHP